MAHLNPYAAEQIERRRLAEIIAKQKQIKVKSAMRYLQRASAPEGKQRIIHPRFTGVKPAVAQKAIKFIEHERERLQPKGFFERQAETLKELERIRASGKQKWKQLTIADLRTGDEVSLAEEIATLSNLYEDAEDILDIDADLLSKVIRGDVIRRLERDEVEGQYVSLRRDEDLLDQYGIDLEHLDRESIIVHNTLQSLHDLPMANILREAIGNGEVSIDSFEKGAGLFGELESKRVHTILEAYYDYIHTGSYQCWDSAEGKWIRKSEPIDLDQMFELYLADGTTTTDVEDSLFWAWFRELFYC